GRLERGHLAPRRVYAGHHVLDSAVLAGRVHGLKYQQYCPSILRVESRLKLGEHLDAGLQSLLGTRLVLIIHVARVARVVILEAKFLAVRDAVRPRELACSFKSLVVLHLSSSSFNSDAALRTPCAFAGARCGRPIPRPDRGGPESQSGLQQARPTAHHRATGLGSRPRQARADPE